MIRRLSNIITDGKEFIYRHTALRYACYLAILLALLLFWLYSDGAEVAFVYNAF